MKAVLQRVSNCSVTVNNKIVGSIDNGLLVYLGVEEDDADDDIVYLAKKITNLRVFEDSDGKMNLSLQDFENYGILVISQFTLLADTRKGRRPSYSNAATPETAEAKYNDFIEHLRVLGFDPAHGEFQAYMRVSYTNEGPVTIQLDSKNRSRKSK